MMFHSNNFINKFIVVFSALVNKFLPLNLGYLDVSFACFIYSLLDYFVNAIPWKFTFINAPEHNVK